MLGSVLTAIVTPFGPDGAVDFDAFQQLAAHLVDNGSDGIVVAGTTGESPTLTDGERLDLFRAALEAVGDRATVVAGTGTYSTAHSIHLSEQAAELGVDALLVVTPYYNKPPQRGIVAHFEAIAGATDRPIVAYNIPARVVVNIEPETISRLAEIETVRAVKQANPDLGEARHIVSTGLDLYAGDDNLLQPFLELGAVGGVCVHTHVVGPQVAEQVRAAHAGDLERARDDRPRARAGLRAARRRDEPDRDQGGARAARPRGRRPPPAARAGDRRGAGARAVVPRAPRPARHRLEGRYRSRI